MRNWINLVENPLHYVYHGTIDERFVTHPVRMLTHVGTEKSAMMRLSTKIARDYDVEEGLLYKFHFHPGNIVALDHHDGDGLTHTKGVLVNLLVKYFPDITSDNLIETLIHNRIDALSYVNMVEDAGSVSYIIINPECIVYESKRWVHRDELIENGLL